MSAEVLNFKTNNQNDNPRNVLLESHIMPYVHILVCAYVLIKKCIYAPHITFVYVDLICIKLDRL